MKKYLIILSIVFATVACSKIDEEPPIQSGTMDKEYKLPDPKPLTSSQREDYNRRNQEYQNSVN